MLLFWSRRRGPIAPQVLDDPSRAQAIHPLDSIVFLVAPHEVGYNGHRGVNHGMPNTAVELPCVRLAAADSVRQP